MSDQATEPRALRRRAVVLGGGGPVGRGRSAGRGCRFAGCRSHRWNICRRHCRRATRPRPRPHCDELRGRCCGRQLTLSRSHGRIAGIDGWADPRRELAHTGGGAYTNRLHGACSANPSARTRHLRANRLPCSRTSHGHSTSGRHRLVRARGGSRCGMRQRAPLSSEPSRRVRRCPSCGRRSQSETIVT